MEDEIRLLAVYELLAQVFKATSKEECFRWLTQLGVKAHPENFQSEWFVERAAGALKAAHEYYTEKWDA